jgi:O-glycosyl hydrolase
LIRLAGDSYEVSKRLWAMAQFSRFVRPGAVRIDAEGGNEEVHVSAFTNSDGVVTVQVINNSTNATDIELIFDVGKVPASLKSFLSDNENDLTYLGQVTTGNNGTWESTLPARSMLSFVGVLVLHERLEELVETWSVPAREQI